jgi:hypothetical protein
MTTHAMPEGWSSRTEILCDRRGSRAGRWLYLEHCAEFLRADRSRYGDRYGLCVRACARNPHGVIV